MQNPGPADDDLEATFASYVAPDPSEDDSFDGVVVVQQQPAEASAVIDVPPAGESPEQTAEQAAPVAEPAMEQVQAEPIAEAAKACCICGLDLSHKHRARDRAGRHWCDFCNDFGSGNARMMGTIPCPDCGNDIRPMLMVDQAGEKVCPPCKQNYAAERKHRLVHRMAVTAHPETEIRRTIRSMVKVIIGLTVLAGVVTLYHFRLLYFRPRGWVPFESALCFCGAMAVGIVIIIVIQYIRMAIRRRARLAEYDEMVRVATNHVLALDEDSHTMGINETPEPLRRRVERAITRVEAQGGLGMPEAHKIIESLARHSDPAPLVDFLIKQRPNKTDIVARNREIATISYLRVDLATATSAITAILLRVHNDQDAMTRLALINFRNGELEQAKKIFKRVIHVAREKNSQVDLAAAFCNLGMLHVMLNEFDDGAVRYGQAMSIYKKLEREDGEADCLLNLGLISFKQKKWIEVEDLLRKAMAINKRRDRREGLAICCSLLGVILVEKEEPEIKEARKLLNQAVQLNLELGRPGGVAAAYGNLGLACVKQEDFTGATELFHRALNIYQRIKRPKMTAKIQGMLKTVAALSAAKAARGR